MQPHVGTVVVLTPPHFKDSCLSSSSPLHLSPPPTPFSLLGILVLRTIGSHKGLHVPLAGDQILSCIPSGPQNVLECAYHWAFFFFKDVIYLFERESRARQRARGGGRRAEREIGSPLDREPDAGLDPRALES